MATGLLRRREVLGTLVAACASLAGCTSSEEEETPQRDELEHFGYGGEPVVHGQTGDGTPQGGDDSGVDPDSDPEQPEERSTAEDGGGDGGGFPVASNPDTDYGYQGYAEGGYGGVSS